VSFNNVDMTINDIKDFIEEKLNNIINENKPHKHIQSKKSFIKNGIEDLFHDYSGYVETYIKEDIDDLYKKVRENNYNEYGIYSSPIDFVLDELKVDSWSNTHLCNCQKRWVTYMELLENEFHEYIYNKFNTENKEGEYNSKLEALSILFYDAINELDVDNYYSKIIRTI
jgi:hypothetical protein